MTSVAKEIPDNFAIVAASGDTRARKYTYKKLDETSDVLSRGLLEIGITKGTRTALMVPPGPDFFSLVFALFKTGAILVGFDPPAHLECHRRFTGRCLAEAEPEAFIGNRKAHLARRLAGWARDTLRYRISTEALMISGRTVHLQEVHRLGVETGTDPAGKPGGPDPAAILFTSGSTGTPKGVVYTHANFYAQVKALQKTFDIQPGEIDVATFPLFALFGPVMGMTSVIPDMDFTRPGSVDAQMIIDTVRKYKATTMFGSPALLDRVGRWGEARAISLPSLRRVLCAGAPVAPSNLYRFGKMLDPGVRIHTPYGATEALPVSSIASDEVLDETRLFTEQGKGTCVGRPVDGVTVKIIRISDEPVPSWHDDLLLGDNEVGEIVVQGPQVTGHYYRRESANLHAKITVSGNKFFHRMGDLGYLDDHGRLWFCGRKSQRVVCADGTLFTIPSEAVFNVHPLVYRTALVGVNKNGSVIPVICVELEADHKRADQNIIQQELMELGGRFEHTKMIREFLFHPGFPVDIRHNAKIGREQLGIWAGRVIG